jgi:predicted Zn-dependent protease with MMP-like domain
MDVKKFERLVARAIERLPEEFCERMENVDIVVADEPTGEQLTKLERERGESLFGLYEGIPLTQRSENYGFVMPDKITIFRKPIEAACRNESEIVGQIQDTVQHEIAHHFGIDDDRLEELGRE